MNETIRLIISLSLSGSILACVLFAIKPLIRNRLSKSIQYYIWFVVILRLVFPLSFDNSIMNAVFDSRRATAAADLREGQNSSGSFAYPGASGGSFEGRSGSNADHDNNYGGSNGGYNHNHDIGDKGGNSGSFFDIILHYSIYIWLLGVFISIALNLAGYIRFSRYLKSVSKPAAAEESLMLAYLRGGHGNIRLMRSSLASSPMLIGIFKPYIFIPDINFDEKQLKYILLHEATHLKRFDIAVKWLTMIAVSVHWFNPLMYFVRREMNRACELSCDEEVIRNLSSADKQAYGDTLISIVSMHKYPVGILQATMSEQKETIKERLVSIMKYNKKSKFTIFISAALMVFILCAAVLLGSCSSLTNAAEDVKTGASDIGTPSAPPADEGTAADDEQTTIAAVAEVVRTFGSRLKSVPLLASKAELERSMRENYGGLVTEALIDKWLADPLNAPGRLTSSPWPDRIEIRSIQKISDDADARDAYEVKGEIIEITSVEVEGGGVAAKRPITLVVEKTDGRWVITDVMLGAYEEADSIVYNNTQYGFDFTLPATWKGYRIVIHVWEGFSLNVSDNGKITANGPVINIRHPLWTSQEPRQDIPIMVFTIGQWNSLQKGEFHIGAAPMLPSELGRNSRYVFALPARYNYAFPAGFEEVETILSDKPLKPTESFK